MKTDDILQDIVELLEHEVLHATCCNDSQGTRVGLEYARKLVLGYMSKDKPKTNECEVEIVHSDSPKWQHELEAFFEGDK